MFTVIDYYRGFEIIGRYDDVCEAGKAASKHWRETNGECDVKVYNVETGRFLTDDEEGENDENS